MDLPELSDLDVCEVLSTIVARVLGHLRRHGLLSDDGSALESSEAEADGEQLVLSALATAATFGKDLAGPERRPGRIPYAYEAGTQPRLQAPLCAAQAGFTLHASTHVEGGDKEGRERLIKYILRPPLAAERLERVEGGRVRLRLKREFSDGTWAIEMDEVSLCARLAALVPPPWQNQVRYSGVLAPASKLRPRILPKPPAEPEAADAGCAHAQAPLEPAAAGARRVPKGKGSRYWPWRLLKARTFGEPTTACPECGGELRFRVLVQDAQNIQRILTHLGLPTDVPRPAPARGPPYYRGRVVRVRSGGAQQELLP